MTFTKSGRKSERWTFEEVSTSHGAALFFTLVTELLVQDCRIARVCVLEGSYCYQVRAPDGTTSMKTITPNEEPISHFITCELNEEIDFNV